jgi:hypothetical protein
MYGEDAPSVPAIGAARFDGLALLQGAAVLYAVRDCKDKNCRRALNGAIAVNHFADAAMTQYQRQHVRIAARRAARHPAATRILRHAGSALTRQRCACVQGGLDATQAHVSTALTLGASRGLDVR